MKNWFHSVRHWEYWPTWVVYFPVFFVWIYYSIRMRSLFFFNAVNPGIPNGGFTNTSKRAIYNLIPSVFYPKTLLVKRGEKPNVERLKKSFDLPFFVKPDRGLRGIKVQEIHLWEEFLDYLNTADFDFLIQETIPFEQELGVFYVRLPFEPKGKITGLVQKEGITIIGNGKSTLKELLLENPRYARQIGKNIEAPLHSIPKAGEVLHLMKYGTHNRGAKFLDVSNQINAALTNTIDEVCQQIPGFYYGRLDIKFNQWEELVKGENFSIIELNGALSEPAHIYDPKHSYLDGLSVILKHYNYLYNIARFNKKNGIKPLTTREGLAQFRQHANNLKAFKKML